jgi:hypothetical protein
MHDRVQALFQSQRLHFNAGFCRLDQQLLSEASRAASFLLALKKSGTRKAKTPFRTLSDT